MDIIKNNKKHILFGGASTGLFYVTGIINNNQLLPFFLGSSLISYVGKEHIFNKKDDEPTEGPEQKQYDVVFTRKWCDNENCENFNN